VTGETAANGVLIVTADDYGYSRSYDRGILEAARERAVDAVSAMVWGFSFDPEPLAETGVAVGLHLDLPSQVTRPWGGRGFERRVAQWAIDAQLERFERAFGRPPAYVDGHHHCHACSAETAAVVAITAQGRGMPVRSVAPGHRSLLRRAGVPTPDLLVGRTDPADPIVPRELRDAIEGDGRLPSGVTEWMVHPGYADPASGSSYDAQREEDLGLVLELADEKRLRAARATHEAALGGVRHG
jgi:predicted glycoside hydrolase/deacetylase ChbG (UPF0249 family)